MSIHYDMYHASWVPRAILDHRITKDRRGLDGISICIQGDTDSVLPGAERHSREAGYLSEEQCGRLDKSFIKTFCLVDCTYQLALRLVTRH